MNVIKDISDKKMFIPSRKNHFLNWIIIMVFNIVVGILLSLGIQRIIVLQLIMHGGIIVFCAIMAWEVTGNRISIFSEGKGKFLRGWKIEITREFEALLESINQQNPQNQNESELNKLRNIIFENFDGPYCYDKHVGVIYVRDYSDVMKLLMKL